MEDTDLVWPREFWLLDLEVEESSEGDAIENPGCKTENKWIIMLGHQMC